MLVLGPTLRRESGEAEGMIRIAARKILLGICSILMSGGDALSEEMLAPIQAFANVGPLVSPFTVISLVGKKC